jgi:hypothetical protein
MSGLLLKQALGLPLETVLLRVELEPAGEMLELTVAHPELPVVAEGCKPTMVSPVWVQDDSRYAGRLLVWDRSEL